MFPIQSALNSHFLPWYKFRGFTVFVTKDFGHSKKDGFFFWGLPTIFVDD
jgi:hypothetical protein